MGIFLLILSQGPPLSPDCGSSQHRGAHTPAPASLCQPLVYSSKRVCSPIPEQGPKPTFGLQLSSPCMAFEGAALPSLLKPVSELPPDDRYGHQSHIATCEYTISCPPGGGWTPDSWSASRSQAIPCALKRYLYSPCGVPCNRFTDKQRGSGKRAGDHKW